MAYNDASEPLSVSELTAAIQATLQRGFRGIWVSGEISGFSRPRSGHLYFDLKDAESSIKAVVWRGSAERLDFEPEDGLEVLCRGDIDVYPPRGTYQLVVREMIPRGVGGLELAFRRRFEQLSAEGLFDERLKRPIPRIPRTIAFVTSPTGAAIRDFLQIVRRRWPAVRVILVPSQVQGAEAAAEIVAGIKAANRLQGSDRPDVVVVGRGGGSLEDLWCFNEEIVVRAVRGSEIPIVSAVGHEIDVTLSDLAADLRAATPSEAAERLVPSEAEFRERLSQIGQTLVERLRRRALEARGRLDDLASRPALSQPLDRVHRLSQQVDQLQQRLDSSIRMTTSRFRERLGQAAGRLEGVSPLAVLGRGYAVVGRVTPATAGFEHVTSVSQLAAGDRLDIRLADGKVNATVQGVENQDDSASR